MNPRYPDLVGQWAAEGIDDRAKVWTVTRAADGSLEDRLDDSFLEAIGENESIDVLVDVLLAASAQQDIAETRAW